MNPRERLEPVAVGQPEVEQDHVGTVAPENGQARLERVDNIHRELARELAGQDVLHKVGESDVVLDQEHADRFGYRRGLHAGIHSETEAYDSGSFLHSTNRRSFRIGDFLIRSRT